MPRPPGRPGAEPRGRGGGSAEPIHFLHIGKCAGTRFGDIAARLNAAGGSSRIVLHGHSLALHDLPPREAWMSGAFPASDAPQQRDSAAPASKDH